MIDPPDYSASDIHWLRPPEVEGEEGTWVSQWLLRMAADPGESLLSEVESRLLATEAAGVKLQLREPDLVRLELTTYDHPLSPECYPLIDRVLIEIDESLGGIAFINDSPRDCWRTFRNQV